MSPSVLSPPEPPSLWSDDRVPRGGPAGPPQPPAGDPPKVGRRRPGRRPPLALLLVVCSLPGGGTPAGALAATGQLGHDPVTRTPVVQGATATSRHASGS